MFWIVVVLVSGLICGAALLHWGTRWGSTPEERQRQMPGDEYLEGGPPARVAMTRAISISASPEMVWPWISQLGRGAGWYSIDWLDNGRKVSARHLVSWIPEPRLGDATVIGYLRHLDSGRSLAWWVDGVPFCGARSRLVSSFRLDASESGTRLVSRMSADAAGPVGPLALVVFRIIDSIMARRQLLGIRERVESFEADRGSVWDPETGARDQYQSYEVLYASGETAGSAGKGDGARWRDAAIKGRVVERGDQTTDTP